ncbi:MAG TPA: carboxypeptidase regulatory-like domain-containing protein [Candidatus Solibacter sp.]|nr:carboxypeptidase regulatory-like domain-containing protein [Candidatus Solibacter sp.]
MRFERFPIVLLVLLTLSLATAPLFGQSLTTGSISGTVYDPSHAIVPNASVNLKSLDTGMTATATANSAGGFNFGLLKPGRYQITVKQAGFAEITQTMDVQVGQITKADIDLVVAKGTETVEVSGTAPLINTEPSTNTAFSEQQVAQLPSAGGDITNIADTAPGVVVNGTGGYGNFTANGLPATSNLFTVNGENDMDPYFNINNSGASNLTLGQNEISEATVITNPYGGQYGQLAGAQVTYVTKSGTNQFHGNAMYWWNGRMLNANDWMSNNSGSPRPFSNANQWATSVGGPIIKNRLFFFVDYEGMRFLLPNVDQIFAPTPEFVTAAENNVASLHPAEVGDYNKLMSFWQNAPGYAAAVANPGQSYNAPISGDSCDTLSLTGGWTAGTACSLTYTATPKALAWEYIFAPRVDFKISNSDNIFFRYKLDHGLQPTHLDALDSRFDANSLQPSWDTQLQETHVLSANAANSFTATLSHYVAIFSAPTAASTFNYAQVFNEDQTIYNFTSPNGLAPDFPQGRDITQYQFIDDFSYTRGNHTFKFGENFRRYDISDHNFFFNSPGVYWGYTTGAMQSFANGEAYQYRKALNQSSDVPIALWGIGGYAQDEWKATRNLKLTFALRLEHNSNPVCQTNCFANFAGPFSSTASYQAGLAGTGAEYDVPYSSDINTGLHQAYHGVDSILFSPRFGFSWDPRSTGKTVISGGIGLFYDNPAAGLVDNLLANPPATVAIRVRNSPSSLGVLPFDPAGAPTTWADSAAAFSINDSFSQIQTALPTGVAFNPPGFGTLVGTIKSPEWTEWNLSVQQQLNRSTVFIVNYAGNHGARISYSNAWPNAWDQTQLLSEIYGLANPNYGFFSNVPEAPPAGNYGTVTEYRQGAVSSYQGLTFSLARQFSHWIAGHLNYTWSHNLDETSNGGLFQYGFEGTNTILGQINPTGLRASNYGNTDYDVRHLVNGDFVVNPEFHKTGALKWVTEGWQFSGKMFWRTGLPFTLADGNLTGYVTNGGDTVPATIIGNAQTSSCGKSNAAFDLSKPGCLNANGVADTETMIGNYFFVPGAPQIPYPTQHRNQYRGPHYFDMDLNLFKNFKFGERFNFAVGAQAFNVFNHPNFGLPNATFFTGDPTFGGINTMQGTPTSPYGNFLGFDSSPRVMQLSAKIVF